MKLKLSFLSIVYVKFLFSTALISYNVPVNIYMLLQLKISIKMNRTMNNLFYIVDAINKPEYNQPGLYCIMYKIHYHYFVYFPFDV